MRVILARSVVLQYRYVDSSVKVAASPSAKLQLRHRVLHENDVDIPACDHEDDPPCHVSSTGGHCAESD